MANISNKLSTGKSNLPENRAWHHMLRGEYPAALKIFEQILPDCDSIGEWNNYGTCLLLTGNTDAALNAFLYSRNLPMGNRVINLHVGSVLWCQQRYQEACDDWEEEIAPKRLGIRNSTDYAPGIGAAYLIWWAAVRLGNNELFASAISTIERIWETVLYQNPEWPDYIAPFILGRLSGENLMGLAMDGQDLNAGTMRISTTLKIAQFFFYQSGVALRSTNFSYVESLENVLRYGPPYAIVKPEYHIAHHELMPRT